MLCVNTTTSNRDSRETTESTSTRSMEYAFNRDTFISASMNFDDRHTVYVARSLLFSAIQHIIAAVSVCMADQIIASATRPGINSQAHPTM